MARAEGHRRPRRTHHRRAGGDWVDDLNAVVFGELGYVREIESRDVRFFRLSSVIAGRRGSCVGLGALYLALAERLGVGLDGVMVPGHFFVRAAAGGAATSSCCAAARRCPSVVPGKVRPVAGGCAEYLRPLTAAEVAAVHWFNAGNHLRAARDLEGRGARLCARRRRVPGLRGSAREPRRRAPARGRAR